MKKILVMAAAMLFSLQGIHAQTDVTEETDNDDRSVGQAILIRKPGFFFLKASDLKTNTITHEMLR